MCVCVCVCVCVCGCGCYFFDCGGYRCLFVCGGGGGSFVLCVCVVVVVCLFVCDAYLSTSICMCGEMRDLTQLLLFLFVLFCFV